MSRSKGTNKKILSLGIFKRNINLSSSTHYSKDIGKVKVFKKMCQTPFKKKWVKLQGQGHRVKNNGTHGKVL